MISGICMPAQYRESDSTVNRQSDTAINHDCDMRLGERIKARREELGFRQSDLARRSGVSQTTISDLERGRNASTTQLAAIAKALRISADTLATGDVSSQQQQPALPLTEDHDELLRLWGLLSAQQRVDQMISLRELASRNIDLVRELGHLAPGIGKPVPDGEVARHIKPAPIARARKLKT